MEAARQGAGLRPSGPCPKPRRAADCPAGENEAPGAGRRRSRKWRSPIHRTSLVRMIRRGEIWVGAPPTRIRAQKLGKVVRWWVIQADPLLEAGLATVLVCAPHKPSSAAVQALRVSVARP